MDVIPLVQVRELCKTNKDLADLLGYAVEEGRFVTGVFSPEHLVLTYHVVTDMGIVTYFAPFGSDEPASIYLQGAMPMTYEQQLGAFDHWAQQMKAPDTFVFVGDQFPEWYFRPYPNPVPETAEAAA